MSIKICLDAGHYGKYNRSPVVSSYYESDMNWKLHLLLKKYLEQYGIEVITTRSKQENDLPLSSRGKSAKGCNLFLSIHSNACDTESVDYPVVIVPINGSGDAIGQKLVDCIKKTIGTTQNGKMYSKKGTNGDYYGVIRGAVSVDVPGLILEHSFHTNTRATNWLLSDSNLDKLAQAEAAVIAEHYGLKKTSSEDKEPTVETKNQVYRVRKSWADAKSQIGAFSDLCNAKALADKNSGYKVYDIDGNVVYDTAAAKTQEAFKPYLVRVDASTLNVRAGAGTSFKVNTTVKNGEVYTIVEENGTWGKLKSGAGWVSLNYCTKI